MFHILVSSKSPLFHSVEGVQTYAEHLSAALPSLCSPAHPKPSHLGSGQVIVEARSCDAAKQPYRAWRCVWVLLRASWWEPNMQISSVHLLCVSLTHQTSHLDSSDQSTGLIGLPQSWFPCSSSTMKSWFTQSPLNSRCSDLLLELWEALMWDLILIYQVYNIRC